MKKLAKNILRFCNEDIPNIYLKFFYRWQLKNKLMDKKIKNKDYEEEILNYWSNFNVTIKTDWHKWYTSKNGVRDVRYIPEDIFYTKIEPFYNRVQMKNAYTDKALNSVWFPSVKKPVTIIKNMSGTCYDDDFNIMSIEDVLERCQTYKRLIIKPTIDSGAGKSIEFLEAQKTSEMREKLKEKIKLFSKDYLIQEILEQHDSLKNLNPTSVNTIRMTTFLHNNQVSVLTSHIRIGVDNSKYDHYGIVCGIKDDGYLQNFACKYKKGDIIKSHPQGYEFKNIKIPSFYEMKKIAMKEHEKFGHFRLISWDFSVDKEGEPILIEINLRWQGLNHHQLTIGPLFGDLTDEVLSEVLLKK